MHWESNLNKEQRTYVVNQVRTHAKWLLENAALVKPIDQSESDVAYALVAAGFEILERPINQVTMPASEEQLANRAEFEVYVAAINDLLATTTEAVFAADDSVNPADVLNNFMTQAAAIKLGA